MNNTFFHTAYCLLRGQTLTRIHMNLALSKETLQGHVVDIGGGRNPDYFSYFQQKDARVETIDQSISGIDFEQDALPFNDKSVDVVILCNVLEHIYHYDFLLAEIRRILKPNGRCVGFVPFWVGYHPDPHDYFRYTHECLKRIFTETGFDIMYIDSIGSSPILANFNTIVLSVPKIVRPILYGFYFIADQVFLRLRPRSKERNPFGYVFSIK
jgi:SAM-dependent methyltransferase